MKKYVSRYLNVIDLGDTALLFNGINGCMDEVPAGMGKALGSGDPAGLAALSPEALSALEKRGHITSLPPGEELSRFREFCSALHARREKNAAGAGLMFLMSYNCNLACKYCYQQEHRQRHKAVMSERLVEEIFEKHLSAMIPGSSLEKFEVTFYGGEPFLPANGPVIRKVLEYARRHGFPARAISNATAVHLMPDIFGAGPGLVNSVQVSLDGSRSLHDTSRVPVSGEGTFDRITDNILLLLRRGTKVRIRLNLDRRTMATVPQLVKELKEKGILSHANASIYASPLHDNISKVDATDFMDLSELSARVFDLGIDLEHPVSLRANEMSYLFSLQKGIGLTHTCYCMQTMQRVLVIDPYGDLYACFEEAGYPELRVGRVSGGGVEFFPLRDRYKARSVANMDKCMECPVALACGGQCGAQCRAKTGDIFEPHCAGIRELILAGLKFAYLKKRSGPETAASAAPEPESFHG